MATPLRDLKGTVTLTGAEPHVVSNTAGAQLTFRTCVPTDKGSISSVYGDLASWCSEITDLAGATVPLDPAKRRQIIMTISSAGPGELRVQGIDLSYKFGYQNGTQRVGEYVWLRYKE
ncbi:hypothetical protein GCM10009623_32740 [Nocardioides aestuarii]|uniref:Uncharacterized protein n=1 Tax=Nocardioides aestuarii TaxID=252231 RepID=A0ABW4TRU2_9ACTN